MSGLGLSALEARLAGGLQRAGVRWGLRALLALPFVISALVKAIDPQAALAEVRALGLPVPALALAATLLVQVVGAALLLQGRFAHLGAALLAGFTLAATLVAHRFWSAPPAAFQAQLMTFVEHLALAAGLMFGAGWSVKARSLD